MHEIKLFERNFIFLKYRFFFIDAEYKSGDYMFVCFLFVCFCLFHGHVKLMKAYNDVVSVVRPFHDSE